MAAIKLMIDNNGKTVYYTLVTTERPNNDGFFGAKLFDVNLKSVNLSLSQQREECLRQVKNHMESKSINKIVAMYGYNIPIDLSDFLLKGVFKV